MKSWIGLGAALALGVAAGGLNWWVLHGEAASRSFVTARGAIDAGRVFTEDDLTPIELRGDLEGLANSAVPFEERAVLLGRPAARDLREGEMVLWSDAVSSPPTELFTEDGEEALPVSLDDVSIVPKLLKVGQEVGFLITVPQPQEARRDESAVDELSIEYVGPFRILSVGERLGPEAPGGRSSRGTDERVITVAIRREGRAGANVLKDDSRKLVEAIDAMRSSRGSGRRIVSILLQATQRPVRTAERTSG